MLERRRAGGIEEEALERSHAFQIAILAVPCGKVSTYGQIAEAAGYPRRHRAVARLLGEAGLADLPWHRIVGADGTLKTSGASADEQRARLRLEGVRFEKDKIDLRVFLYRSGGAVGMDEE